MPFKSRGASRGPRFGVLVDSLHSRAWREARLGDEMMLRSAGADLVVRTGAQQR